MIWEVVKMVERRLERKQQKSKRVKRTLTPSVPVLPMPRKREGHSFLSDCHVGFPD